MDNKDVLHGFTDVLKKKGEEFKPVDHAQADGHEFHAALSNAMKTSPKVKEFVHLYEPHEYTGMKTFLSPDKASGYAVKPDGDIVSVFSTQKGRGDHIMQHALQNGGSKLDAFDGYLPGFYQKHGFVETHREKNWTPGQPDVVYMKHKSKLAASEDTSSAIAKSEYYLSKHAELVKSETIADGQDYYFMAYDGDNAGRMIGRAILHDDPTELHDASNRIAHGHDIVRDWVESHQGKVISGGGDEGTFTIPAAAIEDIEKLRSDYQYSTQLTMTVGVGKKLSEAGRALMVGKFRGKDQVCIYDASIDQELRAAKEHLANGTATQEEAKLGEAYLKEGDDMNKPNPQAPGPLAESEAVAPQGHDCAYCQELAQDSVVDEDHCTYCHDESPQDVGHNCDYCAQAQTQDHEHSGDDCEYCNRVEQPVEGVHEHSGDDCEYCARANHDPSVEGHPADCQYCASAESRLPVAGPGPGDMPGTTMQDNVSHPDAYGDVNAPTDMGMAEDEVPEQGPDLSEVLQGGLDSHADNIAREKVVGMVSEALQGFKACKPIIERSQQQAPELYNASIAMLKAMIEMAKMLGLAPKEEQAEAAIPGEGAPQQQTESDSNPQNPQGNPQAGGPAAGKPQGL